ncbi:YggS family pyridoxal phosphate-dependent enzyme [Sediminivirga luteola]|uniref:Pyridoxal phosphate homeostasis protein n=1 Tax=Sediminivirga luteola TaxID=1774748 RepID=A0A8J2U0I6_9MICO|nr:YggS family pyridoxal phosphate-dependent enzyme [Sediminivirga luteola]MCI2264499.1 YggS family pyridoxal phosphate-dependent enzyme [Sediminivirga luteola]GGA25605.1 YggS family pyridoxal phosphate enzyme [Sediminivirga luteola]
MSADASGRPGVPPAEDTPGADAAPAVDVASRLADVQAGVDAALERAGREPGSAAILLATKMQPPEPILQAFRAGYTLIGENRVQELVGKAEALSAVPHEAHLIGPLQSNKINKVLGLASCIQSVDSAGLAEKIQRRLEDRDAAIEVFLQVNTSREDSKSGVAPEDAAALARAVSGMERLRIRGLMTIGFPGETPEEIRPSYRELARLREDLISSGALPEHATELSMGMSGDFELAIEEGATMVRIGSTVFGARPKP